MKYSDLNDLTMVELAARGRDLRQELFHLRIQKATAQLEKPSRLRDLRKDIARVETRMSAIRIAAKAAASANAAATRHDAASVAK
jgi:large subunit ribosomal protein L29